jgi:hypothetical protein
MDSLAAGRAPETVTVNTSLLGATASLTNGPEPATLAMYTEPSAREADGEVLARPGVVRHRRVVQAGAGGAPPAAAAGRGVGTSEVVMVRSCVEMYPSAHSMRT